MSRYQPKKSLALFFREAYGVPYLDYPLFGEEGADTYEAFVLRAGGQDYYRSKMRDEMLTSLVAEYTDVAVQKSRPAVLYLNGEYWGIHFIREKVNEHYVAANYNADADTVIIAEGNGTSCKQYQELVQYAASHKLSKQENYEHICTMMDVEEYMDYIIAEICMGNYDNDNIKFFTYGGGKWTWLLYDTDLSLGSAGFNSVEAHLNPNGTGASDWVSTVIINALLKNDTFKDQFLKRMAWQLNTIWSPETLNAKIDEMVSMIEPDMERECQRWDIIDYSTWQHYIAKMRNVSNARAANLIYYIKDYFKLTTAEMRQYGYPI